MEANLIDRQLALEEEMVLNGAVRYREKIIKARAKGAESRTPAGQRLLRSVLVPMTEEIERFHHETSLGRPCHYPEAYLLTSKMDPAILAYLTVKSVVDSLTRRKSLQASAIQIGKLIEDEARLTKFSTDNAAYFNAVMKRISKSNSYAYKRRVLIHAMQQGLKMSWDSWTKSQHYHIGIRMIDLLIQSTGIVQLEYSGAMYTLQPTAEALDWITKENESLEFLCPSYLPMLCQPNDWTTPYDGGYLSPSIPRPTLVKVHDKDYLDMLAKQDMPIVYAAVNAIQKTPWAINNKVLEVALNLWEANSEIAGLPMREDELPPVCPLGPKEHSDNLSPERQQVFNEWKLQATATYDRNMYNRSRRLQVDRMLSVADRFKDETIYFPYTLDFRGRIYATPMFLNPQGCDLSKGLLTFSQGKPLSSQQAVDWLAIHGANTFGYDKVSLVDRCKWTTENTKRINACAEDPYGNLWWTEADKPFQFLAFCFEWADYTRLGPSFVSRLPIQLDGSCNGLQHFSAMLRDEVGGRAVNLVPSDVPQDIYQVVADVTLRKLKELFNGVTDSIGSGNWPDGSYLCTRWLEYGIDRKMTKRPVMILPYGGTKVACREYIEEALMDKDPKFFEDTFRACRFLADIIWDSIGEVVVSARSAMDWLRQCARILSKTGKDIYWTTPIGFPVVQQYRKQVSKRIETHLSGRVRLRTTILQPTNKLDKRKQENGISPNFVHSLDATALMLYIVDAYAAGIRNFAVIHDSYGTLASDSDLSVNILRSSFCNLYDNDVLSSFRDELQSQSDEQLPPIPPKGSLDLSRVKESQFFFA